MKLTLSQPSNLHWASMQGPNTLKDTLLEFELGVSSLGLLTNGRNPHVTQNTIDDQVHMVKEGSHTQLALNAELLSRLDRNPTGDVRGVARHLILTTLNLVGDNSHIGRTAVAAVDATHFPY